MTSTGGPSCGLIDAVRKHDSSKRKKGPDVWQFRWMENGKPKSVLVGSTEKLLTKVDAERAVEHLRIKINAQNRQQQLPLRSRVGADWKWTSWKPGCRA